MWPVVEPATDLVEGKTLEAICWHLQAVSDGRVTRLLINVPPGSMKSLLVSVFWPAWEWTTKPHLRYVAFSYSASLTERDNRKFLGIVSSPEYQALWGNRFTVDKAGQTLVSNDKTGSKLATSVGGVGTGERGDRAILDDPHNVKEAESDVVRSSTIEWFANAMSNRLNDLKRSAIVIVMQRVHEEDVSGFVLSRKLGYTQLLIPAEFEADRLSVNELGWSDWRSVEGESFWPERYPLSELEHLKRGFSPYAYAGQYQQRPEPKGGGILKREWWQPWASKTLPAFSYIFASVDTAYTEKQENDPSACTLWGVWEDETGQPSVMMVYAWEGRLSFPDLVETIADICRGDPDRKLTKSGLPAAELILIENKAAGISLAQEMRRIFGRGGWAIEMFDPRAQDKVARAHSVSHILSEGLVFVPFYTAEDGKLQPRAWAGRVIHQCATFPKATHDDLCLAGSTYIEMADGRQVRLDQVVVGDMVATPDGPCRVIAAMCTGQKPTYFVDFGDDYLIGTGNHPVWADDDWIQIDKLTPGAMLSASLNRGNIPWGSNHQASLRSSRSCSTGTNTTAIRTPRSPATGTISAEPDICFTGTFGKVCTGLFRRARTFTTRMGSRLTTALRTWNAFSPPTTGLSTQDSVRRTASGQPNLSTSTASVTRQANGTSQRLGENGTGSTLPSILKKPVRRQSSPVRCLKVSGRAFGVARGLLSRTDELFFAPPNAADSSLDTVVVDTVSFMGIIKPVYNLTVEGSHCYFANGVLVHNCDTVTQALRHVRDNGYLLRTVEHKDNVYERTRRRKPEQPLYPV